MNVELTQYYPLIHKIINNFHKKYRNELFNECYIQLYTIQKRFNPLKGNFETYAYKELYFTCLNFISRYSNEELTLDNYTQIDEIDNIRYVDLIEDNSDLDEDISNRDYLVQHDKQLTEVERFVQKKFYVDGVSIKNIIKVYQPFHLITSEKTIRKILKK